MDGLNEQGQYATMDSGGSSGRFIDHEVINDDG